MIRLTIKYLLAFLILTVSSQAADTRLFYEDFETTSYTTHFMEGQFGTATESYWNQFIAEIDQSSTHYAGSYSMVYQPFVTGNPYSQCGLGPVTYGNTSDFDFSDYDGRYWYFRWYQMWEDVAYTGYNKVWYLGCGGDYYYIAKAGSQAFILLISDGFGGDTLDTANGPGPSFDLDDGEWHKMEVMIDFGTGSNGNTWFAIDDESVWTSTGLAFTDRTNPVDCVAWPSNTSGTESGTQHVYLDEMEAWTLDAELAYDATEPTAGAQGSSAIGRRPLWN